MTDRQKTWEIAMAALVLAIVIFTVDLATPLGFAGGVPYAAPVLLALWAPRQRDAFLSATAGTVLTVAGFLLSPGNDPSVTWEVVVANRVLAVGVIWASAVLVVAYRRSLERADASRRELDDVKRGLDQAVIVAITDGDGKIVYVNDRSCDESGYTREELLGQTHRILSSGVHDAAFFAELWQTISTGHIWRGEICNKRKSGELYWTDTTIVPLLGEARKPERYLALRTDVTQRKRAEDKLRQQAALARLGEMAAVVAHEVKNPLAGIRGALQVIGARMPEDSRDRRVVQDICDRVDALHRSLQDMLVFARPRRMDVRTVDLVELVRGAVEQLKGDPGMRHLDVRVEVQPAMLEVDAALVREALLNLLLNAGQAMEGRGRITVRATVSSEMCTLEVEDEGPGIPEDVRAKAFEPFFTTRTRGTGLGLPIVRRTAEAHFGTATITCPPDGGTRVTMAMPVVREARALAR